MSNHDLARVPGEPLDQLVKALTDNGLDDSGKELLGKVARDLLGRKAEQDRLRDQVARLQGELDEARRAIAELKEERDIYLNSLYAMMRDHKFTFTEQELLELEQNGLSLESVIEEIERLQGT